MYVARRRIPMPNSYAAAYQPGHLVEDAVVENWSLVVGEDVDLADDYTAPRPQEDSDNRTAWEAYVVGKGTDPADARAASLDDLRGMYDPPPPPAHDLPANASPEGVDGTGVGRGATPVDESNVPTPGEAPDNRDTTGEEGPERPAKSATKDAWVDYVIAAGGSKEWARDDDTTKADLIAWEPGRNG